MATKPAAAQPALAKILVAPVIGAPDPIAKQIQQEFASAVEKARVSVVANKEERADYTLRAYVVAAKDKNATKVSYIWDVTDPTGKRVNRITGEEVVSGNASKDPWAALTPTVAQNIANKAANSFIAWLPSQTQARYRSPPTSRASPSGSARNRLPRSQRPSRRGPPPSRPPSRHRRLRRRAASPRAAASLP